MVVELLLKNMMELPGQQEELFLQVVYLVVVLMDVQVLDYKTQPGLDQGVLEEKVLLVGQQLSNTTVHHGVVLEQHNLLDG